MYIKSYAKINLALNIIGKREDGYHELDMIMLPLELADVIEIERFYSSRDTYIICDSIPVRNAKYNLAKTAVRAAQEKYGIKRNYDINIHKEIPISAGLGGGSSNAAQVLKAVLKIEHKKPTNEELIEMGLKIGADVPFFLFNKPSRVQGIGEIVTPIKSKVKYHCLLVKPAEGCSTKEIYALSDEMEHKPTDIDALIRAFEAGSDDEIANLMSNDLQSAAISKVPEIQSIIDSLKADGLKMVMMSGSGSCVYALSREKALLNRLEKKYDKLGYEVILTKLL